MTLVLADHLATSLGSALAGPIGRIIDAPTAFLIAGLVQPFAGLLLPKLVVARPADTSDAIACARS